MRVGLIEAEILETLWVPQYLAPLLGQGDDLPGAFLLSRHSHPEHLLGL